MSRRAALAQAFHRIDGTTPPVESAHVAKVRTLPTGPSPTSVYAPYYSHRSFDYARMLDDGLDVS